MVAQGGGTGTAAPVTYLPPSRRALGTYRAQDRLGPITWSLSLRRSQLSDSVIINGQLEFHGIDAMNPGPINLNERDSQIIC